MSDPKPPWLASLRNLSSTDAPVEDAQCSLNAKAKTRGWSKSTTGMFKEIEIVVEANTTSGNEDTGDMEDAGVEIPRSW